MNVKLMDGGPCRKMLTVSVSAQDTMEERKRVSKAFVAEASIPGFRVGKAPEKMVELKYSKSINSETVDRLIPRLYRTAIEQEKLSPVAVVEVSGIKYDLSSGLTFVVTLDVAPDFNLPKYKGLSVAAEVIKVEPKDVDAQYDRIVGSMATYEAADKRPVEKNDLVSIDYSGTLDGVPLLSLLPPKAGIAEGKDFSMVISDQEFIKGLSAGIIGMNAGETKNITVEFPVDHQMKAIAGKKAVYSVALKNIKKKVMPLLDKDFFSRFGVDSETALREKISSDIRSYLESGDKTRKKNIIIDSLVKNTVIDVPQSVLAQEKDITLRSILRRITMQGATREQVEAQKDMILSTAEETSVTRVKATYILSKIADAEKIAIADEDVDRRVEELATQYGVTKDAMRVDIDKRNGMEALRSDIRDDKTLDFLLANSVTA